MATAVAATFVCERLVGGHLTAVDRSAKMVEAAARRNAAYVDAGTADFVVAGLEELDLGDRRFDKIFAVRIGDSSTASRSVRGSWPRGGSLPVARSPRSMTPLRKPGSRASRSAS